MKPTSESPSLSKLQRLVLFPRPVTFVAPPALPMFDRRQLIAAPFCDHHLAMPSPVSQPTLFPPATPEHILAFQFSSWYPRFSALSIKSTVVRPLGQEFLDYLNADGVFMPEGAEDVSVCRLN